MLAELVTACRFAGIPTNRSPSFVKATTDGVVLEPSEFSMTFACFPSITATHELVVPRSMPMTAPLTPSDLNHKLPFIGCYISGKTIEGTPFTCF